MRKKEYALRISEQDFEKCKTIVMADYPKEGAAFLLAGKKKIGDIEELIVRRVIEIPKSEYRIQSDNHLDISPRAINGLISLCEMNSLGVIFCHSHPTDSPYSPSDDRGEGRLAKTIWNFLPEAPVGSLLISPNMMRARIWKASSSKDISLVTIIGRCIRKIYLINAKNEAKDSHNDVYDRQILAFGSKGQRLIAGTKVGIVGSGGTGSPIGEQLARMGVKDVVVIDPDDFSPSNITRVYGSFIKDIKYKWFPFIKRRRSKVKIAAKHMKKINPKIHMRTINDSVVKDYAIEALKDRDVIFLCTDEHWGRSVVNQLSYQYIIPVINMGVRIDSKKGTIKGAAGAVDVIRPDKPCLWCSGFLNADRIMTESLPLHERKVLLREGYVEDIDNAAPSVIPFTTVLSGHATAIFLQMVTDFMGQSGDIYRLNYFIMESEVSRGSKSVDPDCICGKVKGYGDMKSMPISK